MGPRLVSGRVSPAICHLCTLRRPGISWAPTVGDGCRSAAFLFLLSMMHCKHLLLMLIDELELFVVSLIMILFQFQLKLLLL